MSGRDLKNTFGPTPESFKYRVGDALRLAKEDNKMKRTGLRMALVIAATLVLLTGVVYAAATDWKLLDFFKSYGKDLTTDAQAIISDIQKNYEVDGLNFTVQEAIADGKFLYLTMKVSPKEGENPLLLGIDIMPGDPVYRSDAGETRTYTEIAQAENRPIRHVFMNLEAQGYSTNSFDYVTQSDGSLLFILSGEFPATGDAIEATLTLGTYTWNLDGSMVPDSDVRTTYPISLPVSKPLAVATYPGSKTPVEGTAALLDSVDFTLTPLTLHYEIHYTLDEKKPAELQAFLKDGLIFEFLNEKGTAVDGGLTRQGSTDSEDGVHFIQLGSLNLSALPETVTLRGFDYMENNRFGQVTLTKE